MKTFKFIIPLCFLSIGIVFFACEKEGIDVPDNDEISKEVLQKIESLSLNADDVTFGSIELPDGSKMNSYIVEGDIAITVDQLAAMSLLDGVAGEQYRTYNLVTTPQTIDVIGYTGSGNALSSKMQTALQWAINNYNRCNIGLSFNLTYGTDYSSKDIVVYQVSGAAGGMAGFPSGGAPYKWVQIFSGIDSYDTNVVEHVITHEIGHCVGLRHTDWATRASCGSGSGEDANPYGAVHIPGTPTGYDSNSIMRACFNSSEEGEFGYYDEVALEYLY
ncbi:MAG: zinc-dependent metalloprotease [Bacteroidales bacterium]|nr:zinc-dependent metalloprotease [Bacteroidales bacterium]